LHVYILSGLSGNTEVKKPGKDILPGIFFKYIVNLAIAGITIY